MYLIGHSSSALFFEDEQFCKLLSGKLSSLYYTDINSLLHCEKIISVKKLYEITIVSHGTLLINLSSPDEEKRKRFIKIAIDDCLFHQMFDSKLIVFHPGSSLKQNSFEKSLENLFDSLWHICSATKINIAIENMVRGGGKLLVNLEQINYFIQMLSNFVFKDRISICLDTCHLFSTGINIIDKSTWETLSYFKELVSIVHLNDSKTKFNSGLDRHAPLTTGFLSDFFKDNLFLDFIHYFSPQYVVMETTKDRLIMENELNMF